MLSRIDEIIYPNRCEVFEFPDPQRFVYPIFKNGSSSIREYAHQQNHKMLINEQIKKISTVDIVLRDPISRFISGINTFLWMTKRDYPTLDTKTILHFAENYLFLNRHYAPQLTWIINLSKYTNKDVQFRFHSMDYITELTNIKLKPDREEQILQPDDIERLKNNIYNETYLRIDNILLSFVNQTVLFNEIINSIKIQDPVAYQKLKCIALD
jgi:hypothetical protein